VVVSLASRTSSHDGGSIAGSLLMIRSALILDMGGKTKVLQVEYHWMGRWRVDKRIFGALRW
jgi:hypothetical protein